MHGECPVAGSMIRLGIPQRGLEPQVMCWTRCSGSRCPLTQRLEGSIHKQTNRGVIYSFSKMAQDRWQRERAKKASF